MPYLRLSDKPRNDHNLTPEKLKLFLKNTLLIIMDDLPFKPSKKAGDGV